MTTQLGCTVSIEAFTKAVDVVFNHKQKKNFKEIAGNGFTIDSYNLEVKGKVVAKAALYINKRDQYSVYLQNFDEDMEKLFWSTFDKA